MSHGAEAVAGGDTRPSLPLEAGLVRIAGDSLPEGKDAASAPTADGEVATRELSALRHVVERQTQHLDSLSARLDSLMSREPDWRPLLFEAHEQLLRRDQELASFRSTLERARAEIARREEERISLRAALEYAHAEIQRRDAALASLHATLECAHQESARSEEAVASLKAKLQDEQDRNLGRQGQIASLEAELAQARGELDQIRSSRLWWLGSRYWLIRDWVRTIIRLR